MYFLISERSCLIPTNLLEVLFMEVPYPPPPPHPPHSEGLLVLQPLAARGKAKENELEGEEPVLLFPALKVFVSITRGTLVLHWRLVYFSFHSVRSPFI